MAANEKLTVKPVDKSNWDDFEKLFESKGGPSYCWCMAWRMTSDELKNNNADSRRKYIKKRVDAGTPIGMLAYVNGEAIGWCSVAPRETHEGLGGDGDIEKVWSVTCFYIQKEHRKDGLVSTLIEQAKKYAKKHGAKFLEGYPVEPDSPSYRFMGFVKTFKKEGFEFVKKEGKRRNVMTCKL